PPQNLLFFRRNLAADDLRRRRIVPATPNLRPLLRFRPQIVFPNRFYPETVFASFRSPGHFRAQFPSTIRMATSSRAPKRPRQ
ncbi:hypothetical protein LINGRAHAP2_LOCUS20204, partial [Linum grandiflorum]